MLSRFFQLRHQRLPAQVQCDGKQKLYFNVLALNSPRLNDSFIMTKRPIQLHHIYLLLLYGYIGLYIAFLHIPV